MPKKRNAFMQAKPSTPTHPALSTDKSRPSPSTSPSSVNEQLQRLRAGQRSTTSNHVSTPPNHPLPPSVQHILQIPQTPAPRPRPGMTIRGGRRGPAGPPPPGSWLQKQAQQRNSPQTEVETRSDVKIRTLPGTRLPASGSLAAKCLRQLAQHWDIHVEYDQYYLCTIPVALKEILLHYIARYSPNGIDRRGLEILFCEQDELDGATGADEFARLDVSGAIGRGLPLRDLQRFFQLSQEAKSTTGTQETETLPDDWNTPEAPSRGLAPPKFANVTHLALANPPVALADRAGLWPQLLDMAECLGSITHLSLAYWPVPSLHPNSSTAAYATLRGDVRFSVGDYYCLLDENYLEAAYVMRQLSKHLLGLKYLDLTGCRPWFKCIAYPQIDWQKTWAALETVVIDQENCPPIVEGFPHNRDYWEAQTLSPNTEQTSNAWWKHFVIQADAWLIGEMELKELEGTLRMRLKAESTATEHAPPEYKRMYSSEAVWDEVSLFKATEARPQRTARLNLVYASSDPEKQGVSHFVSRCSNNVKAHLAAMGEASFPRWPEQRQAHVFTPRPPPSFDPLGPYRSVMGYDVL